MLCLSVLCSGSLAYAQSSLSLASGAGNKGGSVSLNVTLNATTPSPADFQWTLSYPASDFVSIGAVAGPSLTNAGKTLTCVGGSGTLTCLASGANTNAISSGVAAVVTATLSSSAGGSLETLPMTNVYGALADGTNANMTGSGGTISLAPGVSSVQCAPASLTSGASSTCTVTLSSAISGGASVALSSSNGAVSVPASVNIASGATTGTFTARAGTVTSNQSATITASLNGVSVTTAVTVTASSAISSVQCNPTSIPSAGSSTCTVTLSGAAPSSGAIVTLSDNSSSFTVPASVTVARGATTAAFTARAGTVTSNQTVTITATYSGASVSTAVTVTSTTATLAGIACVATTLTANTSTICAVGTVQAAGSGGVVVALSSNSSSLTVPATVTIASGANYVTFTAAAGAIASTQTATITATSGSSTSTLPITLQGGTSTAQITFVQSAANSSTGSTSSYSLAFPRNTSAGDLVLVAFDFYGSLSLSSITDSQGNTFTAIGSQLTAPWGIHSQVYYAKNIRGGADTVSMRLSGKTPYLEISVVEYAGVDPNSPINAQSGASGSSTSVSSGMGTSIVAGAKVFGYCVAGSQCTAGSGFTTRSTYDLNLIEDMTVTSAGNYAATATASNGWTMQMVALRPASGTQTMKAAATSSLLSAGASTAGSQDVVGGIACPSTIEAGGRATCELNVPAVASPTAIQISSTSAALRAPATVSARPNQGRLAFQVSADAAASGQSVTVTAAGSGGAVSAAITIVAGSRPVLNAPHRRLAKVGAPVQFTVSAADPTGLGVQLAGSNLPSGATFDPASGRFEWTPVQTGAYEAEFIAMGAVGIPAATRVSIDVTSGDPALAAVQACSPGAIGVATGTWLANAEKPVSDASGRSMILGGAKVLVNGQYVPVLQASLDRIEFLCPQADPGTPLQVAVDLAGSVSQSLNSVMQTASPRILTLDDQSQDQGLTYVAGTRNVAMVRNAAVTAASPAQPGDSLLIWGTGFGSASDDAAGKVTVSMDGSNVPVKSITAVAGHAGVYAIEVQAPVPASFDEPVSLQIHAAGADGAAVDSNTVRIAIEPAAQ